MTIEVVSHVGRDILQSAQSFRTPEAAVWEYVVNALQYVDPGVVPVVNVTIDQKAKAITIEDNGAGMTRDDLSHYFTMHGENKARRKGVPGRGKFGTGKSAAFGIGSSLTLTTVRNKKRQRCASTDLPSTRLTVPQCRWRCSKRMLSRPAPRTALR
ncbi:ATP-binding protein [Leifsonia poae]|uniref:ATP-binding protein n=1 Tax=Leifsonia poae TaxID=110933 RepID=UPI003D679D30